MKMMEVNDDELLRRFAANCDEAAFRALVARYLGMVLSVARRAAGDEELARDAAQKTFIRLAQRRGAFPPGVPVVSWLHRTSRSLAIDSVRAETRRRRLEARAAMIQQINHTGEDDWNQIGPALDALIDKLSECDRQIVLLRYYQNHPHAIVGNLLGLSEQAARRRALRALEKLRLMLSRRGIATSSAALALMLPVHAVTPAAAGMASSIAKSSAAAWSTSAAPSLFSPLFTMIGTAKVIIPATSIALVLAAGSWRYFHGPRWSDHTAAGGGALPVAGIPSRSQDTSSHPRSGIPEAEQVAKIRHLLAADEPVSDGALRREISPLMNHLSLAAGEDLLTDHVVLGYFADPGLASGDSQIRFYLCSMLWARYGELAPDAALAKAFPGGKVAAGMNEVSTGSLLAAVSKSDPERAYRICMDNFGSGDPVNQLHEDFAEIMMNWGAKDPDKVLAEIPKLSLEWAKMAYLGYAHSFGPRTDWNAEANRLKELFPDSVGEQFLAESLAAKWVLSDPDAAFSWVASLHLDDGLTLITMLKSWVMEDPLGAVAWLRNREPSGKPRLQPEAGSGNGNAPDSGQRDAFLSFLLNQVTDNVSAAAAVTSLIEDQSARDKAVVDAVNCAGENRDVMLMWERSPSISPAAKEKIAAKRKEIDQADGW